MGEDAVGPLPVGQFDRRERAIFLRRIFKHFGFLICGSGASVWQNKRKTPLPGWQWGSINLVIESEPNCRAAKQQLVQKQVQIQIANHGGKVARRRRSVKWFLERALRYWWS
jgi:hypothetical protein